MLLRMQSHPPPATTHDFCAPWSVEKRDQKHRKKCGLCAGLRNGKGLLSSRILAQPPPGGAGKPRRKGVGVQASPSAKLLLSEGLRGRDQPQGPGRRPHSQGCCKWLKLQAGQERGLPKVLGCPAGVVPQGRSPSLEGARLCSAGRNSFLSFLWGRKASPALPSL